MEIIAVEFTQEEKKDIRILGAYQNKSMRQWIRDQVLQIIKNSAHILDNPLAPILDKVEKPANSWENDGYKEKLAGVFSMSESLKYRPLMDGIMQEFRLPQRKARIALKSWLLSGEIVKNGPERAPNSTYSRKKDGSTN